MWPWNLTDDIEKQECTSSILCPALCIISNPSVNSNWSYSPETLNSGRIWQYFVPCDLTIWWMTLKNNRAPLLSNINRCASFHHHMWIQTGITVRRRLNGVMTSVTLTSDLWPWPFARTSRLSMVITPEKFRMIRWEEHCQKGVTDGLTDRQTDGQTERSILRAAWSQLKTGFSIKTSFSIKSSFSMKSDCTISDWLHALVALNIYTGQSMTARKRGRVHMSGPLIHRRENWVFLDHRGEAMYNSLIDFQWTSTVTKSFQ